MDKKLKWSAVGFEQKTQTLVDILDKELNQIPLDHKKARRKLIGFLTELNSILKQVEYLKKSMIPKLEQMLKLEFPTPELVLIAFCRPSIKNVYQDVAIHLGQDSKNPYSKDEYEELAALGEAAEVLALIGDAVLDLSVVQIHWDSSLSTAGKLTKRKEAIVCRENLAKICDKWDLYEARIRRKQGYSQEQAKDKNIKHTKSTLVEAIFGIIYLEFTFNDVVRLIPLLQ